MDNDIAGVSFAKLTILANLHRHQRAVNVVRFSPNGDQIATSGDDGALIIWRRLMTNQESTSEDTESMKTLRMDRDLLNVGERSDSNNDVSNRQDNGIVEETIESELPNLESWSVVMIK